MTTVWNARMGRSKRVTAEDSFLFKAAVKKQCDVFRAGWPDYLIFDRRSKEYRLVEVKNGPNDALRPSQVKMFEVLEKLGLHVYVWTPREPDTLVRWRTFLKHTEAKKETRRAAKGLDTGRRIMSCA